MTMEIRPVAEDLYPIVGPTGGLHVEHEVVELRGPRPATEVATASATMERAARLVRDLLTTLGEDVELEGLVDTPHRVVRALVELLSGNDLDPAEILSRDFAVPETNGITMVRGIHFSSLCEHHVLPFTGEATIAYLPADGRAVGLSKIPRLVACFSRRLQMQERLTNQICEALMEHAGADGVGVVIEATHACLAIRGARQPEASMLTTAFAGAFADDHSLQLQLLQCHQGVGR